MSEEQQTKMVEAGPTTYLDFYNVMPLVERNYFLKAAPKETPYDVLLPYETQPNNSFNRRLPTFAEAKELLPAPIWDGHDAALRCYWFIWELVQFDKNYQRLTVILPTGV